MPETVRTVALVDPLWVGHHPMYFGQFAASFLRAGARVIGLCPEPEAARREISEACAGIPDWESQVHLRHLKGGNRGFLWGRFGGDPLNNLQRWWLAADAVDRAEQQTGWHIDLVYFPFLDVYLRFLPSASIPEITIGRPWSGLYLRNHHHGRHRTSPVDRLRLLAKGDAILRSPLCRGIGVLDERFAADMEHWCGRSVTPFPDVTQALLPDTEPELVSQIKKKAAGRKIIGLIGLEKRKGTLNMMRVAIKAYELRLPWYFVFGGVLGKLMYSVKDAAFIHGFARKIATGELDNVHFEPDSSRIASEPEFNAWFTSFDIAWAAYEGFQGSSGTLSKAAAFEIPSVATKGECIGQRVERFRTGLTIQEGDSDQALEAIRRLLSGVDWNDQPLAPDYASFREAHSVTRLDSILGDLLRQIDQPARPDVQRYPLTPGQREILMLGKFGDGAGIAFNEALRIDFDEPVNLALLRSSFSEFTKRHPILRSTLHLEENEQRVHPESTLEVQVVQLAESQSLDGVLDELANRPFDLTRDTAGRVHLIHTGPNCSTLFIVTHHAICDGWSSGILIRELGRICRALVDGIAPSLPPVAPFREFVEFEARVRQGDRARVIREFWGDRLKNPPEPLDLPCRKTTTSVGFEAGVIRCELGPELVQRLRQNTKAGRRSLFGDQLGVWTILLSRITGQCDFLTAIPQAGHLAMGSSSLVGQCVRTLPIRLRPDPDLPVGEYLECVAAEIEAVMAHADTSLSELGSAFHLPRCAALPGFATTSFSLLPRTPPLTLPGMPSAEVKVHPRSYWANELGAWVIREGSRFYFEWCFNENLHSEAVVGGWMESYTNLLDQVLADPTTPIGRLALLSETQIADARQQSVITRDYPRDSTVDGLFSDTLARFGTNPALVNHRRNFSYAELDSEADCFATRLQRHGIGLGDIVAVHMSRCPERIAAFLGILRCGAVVMPLDDASPAARLIDLVTSADAKVVIGCPDLPAPDLGIPVLNSRPGEPGKPKPSRHTASDPAFLLHTSGSTGTPKGVVIPHRAIVRLAHAGGDLRVDAHDTLFQFAPASFDVALFEIWSALLNGARIVIPPPEAGLSEIVRSIREEGVTFLWLTAGLFQTMVDEHLADLALLQRLITGGDVASPSHARRFLNAHPHIQLINAYGPTEATTFATTHRVTMEDCLAGDIPIGRPISNTKVTVVDHQLRAVLPGVRGQIAIGGDALATGYLGQPELSSAAFVEIDGCRHYLTGDIGIRDPDGTLRFRGRRDRQIKIRGFRIEPAEIESVIAKFPGVNQVRVAAPDKVLTAWLATETPSDFDKSALRTHIEASLPAWMQPKSIEILKTLPLDANSKISLSALVAGTSPATKRSPEDPVGSTETRLASLWSELLDQSLIHRDSNFFDMGGDSLIGLRLFSRIDRTLGVTLPLACLLESPTLRTLAATIDRAKEEDSVTASGGIVVRLREGKNILFCIHGGDGAVMFYRPLITSLPEGIGVTAIESRELSHHAAVAPGSIEETASAYLKELREVQPHGPYALAGYSYGGVVAWEIACRLMEAGEEVDLLGLFDTHNPAFPLRPMPPHRRLATFWKQQGDGPLANRVAAVVKRTVEGLKTHFRIKRELSEASRGPAPANTQLRRVQVREAHLRAMLAYRPRPFPGKVTLFRAIEGSDKYELPADYHWSNLALGGFKSVPVSGRHDTLFDPGHIDDIGQAISAHFPIRT